MARPVPEAVPPDPLAVPPVRREGHRPGGLQARRQEDHPLAVLPVRRVVARQQEEARRPGRQAPCWEVGLQVPILG